VDEGGGGGFCDLVRVTVLLNRDAEVLVYHIPEVERQ
jgi:hypothetical protein